MFYHTLIFDQLVKIDAIQILDDQIVRAGPTRPKIIKHDSQSIVGRVDDQSVRTIELLTGGRLKILDSDSIADRRHFYTESEYWYQYQSISISIRVSVSEYQSIS